MTNFALQLKRKSSEKGQKCICPLLKLKEFLYCKCILTTSLQIRAQYLKIFVLSKVLSFALLVLLLVWFTMDLQTGQLEDRYQISRANYFIIVIYYKVFLYFFSESIFPKKIFFFFFAFWRKKIRRHSVKGVLL